MASNTAIEWAHHTVNFWQGCIKVSPGCKYCYMYRDKDRYGKNPALVVKVNEKTINKVLKECKPGDRIFTCSWSDFFIKEADFWRTYAWDVIRKNPQLTWMILTKRPERIKECLPDDWGEDGYPNVWLGISAETQEELEKRAPHLLTTPAAIHFVSYEPALGPIDMEKVKVSSCDLFGSPKHSEIFETFSILGTRGDDGSELPYGIDWVIAGGESGNDTGKWLYRPSELEWYDDVVQQCARRGVPVFIKQMGTHLAKALGISRHGKNIEEFPVFLRIRQFPEDDK